MNADKHPVFIGVYRRSSAAIFSRSEGAIALSRGDTQDEG
jgi:hypothetical protein